MTVGANGKKVTPLNFESLKTPSLNGRATDGSQIKGEMRFHREREEKERVGGWRSLEGQRVVASRQCWTLPSGSLQWFTQ